MVKPEHALYSFGSTYGLRDLVSFPGRRVCRGDVRASLDEGGHGCLTPCLCRRFQIVDVVAAMKPLTKMSRQILSPVTIPTLVRDAFRVATEERHGPSRIPSFSGSSFTCVISYYCSTEAAM